MAEAGQVGTELNKQTKNPDLVSCAFWEAV